MTGSTFMTSLEKILPEADRKLYEKRGRPSKQVFGDRPALLIIDVTRRFVGSRPQPILEAIEEYRSSCGEVGWRALPSIQRLLESCRTKHIPVVFTTGDPVTTQFSAGVGATKDDRAKSVDLRQEDISETIMPLPTDLVIRKTKASAFLGTPLLGCLKSLEIDTLLIAGATTSGCVRASVVDAFSYGFRCFVVEECTFDRFQLSHLVSLFDMNGKYADVISLDEALRYLAEVGQYKDRAS